MKRFKSVFVLFLLGVAMVICGCRAHKVQAMYGAPATKYGVQSALFVPSTPNIPIENPSNKS